MFKLVVLCAFFAVAAAKPSALIAAPITQYSTFLTPGATTITRQDSSVIHPSPLVFQAPLTYQAPLTIAHFIKKRSPQFPLTYAAPATLYPSFPNFFAAPTFNTPLIPNAPILTSPIVSPAVHLIKKRSVAAFLAPSTPVLASPYAATAPIFARSPLISQPLIPQPLISQPLISQHLISQPLIAQPLISQPLLTQLIKK